MPTEQPKRPQGRPTLFSDRLVERLLVMATKGATDVEMAEVAGVGISTFMAWKGRHESFREALKDAKEIADMFVEASLYRRATGYSHPAIKFFCYEGVIQTEEYIEHYPPDSTACIFWLKNRQPKRWREKHEIQIDAKPTMVIQRPDGTKVELGVAGAQGVIEGEVEEMDEEPE